MLYGLVGLFLGICAAQIFVATHEVNYSSPVVTANCDAQEADVVELKRIIENLRASKPVGTEIKEVTTTSEAEPTPSSLHSEATHSAELVRWKISAIEKFVPLSDDQRDRLRRKFEVGEANNSQDVESLDDILGAESAQYYRDQVKAAFARAEEQELEKEVLYLSRQLQLTAQEESEMRNAFLKIESQIKENKTGNDDHDTATHSERDQLRTMIQESQKRRDLRTQALRPILPADKYEAYLKGESESPDSDVEVFHDPG